MLIGTVVILKKSREHHDTIFYSLFTISKLNNAFIVCHNMLLYNKYDVHIADMFRSPGG